VKSHEKPSSRKSPCHARLVIYLHFPGATVVQEEEKSYSNQKVVSSIPCRSVLEQDAEPLIAPDVQFAISVNVKMCIHPCKSLWITASAKCKCKCDVMCVCLLSPLP